MHAILITLGIAFIFTVPTNLILVCLGIALGCIAAFGIFSVFCALILSSRSSRAEEKRENKQTYTINKENTLE